MEPSGSPGSEGARLLRATHSTCSGELSCFPPRPAHLRRGGDPAVVGRRLAGLRQRARRDELAPRAVDLARADHRGMGAC
eukprot:14614670-Alexandrium_andersonii.AAC.1